MKRTVRSLIVAAVLVPATLGTMSLVAPAALADRPPRQFCGGEPGGNSCPAGLVCVDVPGDQCNWHRGDKDCLGYCTEPKKPHP